MPAMMQGAFMLSMSFVLMVYAKRTPMDEETLETVVSAIALLFTAGMLYLVFVAPLTAILG